jgi:hypothetical protein
VWLVSGLGDRGHRKQHREPEVGGHDCQAQDEFAGLAALQDWLVVIKPVTDLVTDLLDAGRNVAQADTYQEASLVNRRQSASCAVRCRPSTFSGTQAVGVACEVLVRLDDDVFEHGEIDFIEILDV